MDAEFSRAMLNRACDRLESTSRWSSIFVLILLFFHITSFQPYINLNQLVSYTQMQIVRLEQLEPVVTKLSNALNTINDQKKQIETDYQTTLNGLVTGFQNLNNMVGILQSASEVTLQSTEVGPPQSSASNLRATDQAGLTQPPPDTSLSSKLPAITDRSSRSDQLPGSMLNPMQSQMPLQSPLTSLGMPILDPALSKIIRQTHDPKTLRQILLPYIRETIIEPNFKRLNQQLQERATVIRTQIAMIEEQVMVLQKQTINIEGGRAIWEQVNAIQQSMLEVQQAAKSVRIDPPTNDHWWNTVESKGETLGSLGTLAKEKLIPSSLEQATKQFNQSFALALMQQQNIKTQLDQAMKLLSKSFEDQKRQLGSLGEPFKWISLDLETTVTRFPILLALALATISWVGSQQLFELAYALYLQSLPEKLLWEWYFQRTSDWSKGIYLIRDGYLRLDLVLVGYLIWVTIAAIQTRTLPQVSYIAAGGMLLLAWTILIIAFWHRQKTWHQVMLLKSRTEVPLP